MAMVNSRELEKVHPLTNDVILTEIFKLLPMKDRRQFRLVSKTWLEVSLGLWRATTKLRLEFDKLSNTLRPRHDEEGMSIPQILQVFKTSLSLKPLRHVHLSHLNFGETEGFNEFWELFGSQLESLQLSCCYFTCSKELLHVIYEWCPKLKTFILDSPMPFYSFGLEEIEIFRQFDNIPSFSRKHINLTSLHILCLQNFYVNNIPTIDVNWFEIFSNFPKLAEITFDQSFDFFHESKTDLFLKAMETLKLEHSENFPAKLALNIESYYYTNDKCSKDTMDRLKNLGIRLKGLRINCKNDLNSRQMEEDDLKSHLEFHGKDLTNLALICQNSDFSPVLNFPFGLSLNNLKVLIFGSDSFCEDLEFLKFVPNLTNLRIQNDLGQQRSGQSHQRETHLFGKTRMDKMGNVKLNKLMELRLGYILGTEDIHNLTKWMPNLTELEMFLDDGQFAIICEKWNKLVKLVVRGSNLTDDGLIGKNGIKDDDVSQASLEQAIQSNITNLKFLEHFETCEVTQLTDASVYEGFLKMERLQKVDNIWKSKITLKAREILEKKGISCRRNW